MLVSSGFLPDCVGIGGVDRSPVVGGVVVGNLGSGCLEWVGVTEMFGVGVTDTTEVRSEFDGVGMAGGRPGSPVKNH